MKNIISHFKESKISIVIFASAIVVVGLLIALFVTNIGQSFITSSAGVAYSNKNEIIIPIGTEYKKK